MSVMVCYIPMRCVDGRIRSENEIKLVAKITIRLQCL